MGKNPIFREVAEELGRELARRGITVVYGGGNIGLMGVVADGALAEGGQVIGVIPGSLAQREIVHENLTELHIVETMHERKARMADLSEAFIALPGGYGTLDELCEILTWAQLGFHNKPIGLLNVAGFFDPFLEFITHAHTEGFLRESHYHLLFVETTVQAILTRV
jgi:uncharacterized protein (TIGR00730 family)